jgi:hypothetical protein
MKRSRETISLPCGKREPTNLKHSNPNDPNVRRIPLPIKLGVLALLGGIIWFVIGTVAIGWVSWGDGSVHPANPLQKFGYYMPSAYCFALAFSCLPVVRGIFLLLIGVVANLMLTGVLAVMFTGMSRWSRGDVIVNLAVIIIPLLYLDFQWFALLRQRWKE